MTPGEWWEADWGLVKLAEPLDLPTVTLSADRADPSTITAVGWGSTQWGARSGTFASGGGCAPSWSAAAAAGR